MLRCAGGVFLLTGLVAVPGFAQELPQFRVPSSQYIVPQQAGKGADSLTGDWNSNLGRVRLTQNGRSVSGTLAFSSGGVASISGVRQGSSLSFRFNIQQQVFGSGQLVLSPDAQQLNGTYRDQTNNTGGVFSLTRVGAAATAPPALNVIPRISGDLIRPDMTRPDSSTTRGERQSPVALQNQFVIPSRPLPTDQQIAIMDWAELNSALSRSVSHLRSGLGAIRTGPQWISYLDLSSLQRSFQPTPITQAELRGLLSNFESVEANPQFSMIVRTPGFHETGNVLRRMTQQASTYPQRQVTNSMARLSDSMSSLNTGQDWRDYLQLETVTSSDSPNVGMSFDRRMEMAEIQRRFEYVLNNPEFEVVAKRPGFSEAFENVRRLIRLPLTLPHGARLFRVLGEQEHQRDPRPNISLSTVTGSSVDFGWDVTSVANASGIVWQVGRIGFPFFDSGSSSDWNPVGLLATGRAGATTGQFTVDFSSFAELPPPGYPYVVRVIPTGFAGPQIVGQPSNELNVFLGQGPGASQSAQLEIESEEIVDPDHAIEASIELAFIYCFTTNEDDYFGDNLIKPAGQPPGDEIYLPLAGFHAANGIPVYETPPVIPSVGGILGNGGGHPVFTGVVSRKRINAGETIGFHVMMVESDHLDRVATTQAIGAIAAQITLLLTQDFNQAMETYEDARSFWEKLKQAVPALSDNDDLLGYHFVKFDARELRTIRDAIRESYDRASRGAGQILSTSGNLVVHPELRPEHQKTFDKKESLRFTREGVDYRLDYVVRIRNSNYQPYRP